MVGNSLHLSPLYTVDIIIGFAKICLSTCETLILHFGKESSCFKIRKCKDLSNVSMLSFIY